MSPVSENVPDNKVFRSAIHAVASTDAGCSAQIIAVKRATSASPLNKSIRRQRRIAFAACSKMLVVWNIVGWFPPMA